MNKLYLSTKILILAVTLNAVLGQLLLKRAIFAIGNPPSLTNLSGFMAKAAQSPWVYASIAVQGFGYLLWMILISRVKIGVATASVGAGFYLLMALSAWAVYGEKLSPWQWFGIAFITIGVVFISIVQPS